MIASLALLLVAGCAHLPPLPNVIRAEPAGSTAPTAFLLGSTWADVGTQSYLLDEVLAVGEANAVAYPGDAREWRYAHGERGWDQSCQADFRVEARGTRGWTLSGIARVGTDEATAVPFELRVQAGRFYSFQSEESPSGRCAFGVWLPE